MESAVTRTQRRTRVATRPVIPSPEKSGLGAQESIPGSYQSPKDAACSCPTGGIEADKDCLDGDEQELEGRRLEDKSAMHARATNKKSKTKERKKKYTNLLHQDSEKDGE